MISWDVLKLIVIISPPRKNSASFYKRVSSISIKSFKIILLWQTMPTCFFAQLLTVDSFWILKFRITNANYARIMFVLIANYLSIQDELAFKTKMSSWILGRKTNTLRLIIALDASLVLRKMAGALTWSVLFVSTNGVGFVDSKTLMEKELNQNHSTFTFS